MAIEMNGTVQSRQCICAPYLYENIPTAEEVQANGIPVGEMQAKLLQKIEETTLYLVALDKENKELKKQITELRKMIGK